MVDLPVLKPFLKSERAVRGRASLDARLQCFGSTHWGEPTDVGQPAQVDGGGTGPYVAVYPSATYEFPTQQLSTREELRLCSRCAHRVRAAAPGRAGAGANGDSDHCCCNIKPCLRHPTR